MTQLTQHPFKEVIRKAGATHFWEPDTETNQVVDRIGTADLIRSPGADDESAWMTAQAPGADPSAGPWIGPTLDFSGDFWAGPEQRYLNIPAPANQLAGAFTIFARVKSNSDFGHLRNLLPLVVGGTFWGYMISLDTVFAPGNMDQLALRVQAGTSPPVWLPFGSPYSFGQEPPKPTLYLSWSRSADGIIRARVVIPEQGLLEHTDDQVRPGLVAAPGFFRNADASQTTGGRCTFSNAFILPREATNDELLRWAKLLETGRQGDGRCFPLNNSEGALSGLLEPGDTLLDLADGTASFAAPGPTEEGRVTLIDPVNPAQFEVCALLVNDGAQLEVRRGQEGTEARQWPAGTLVKGLLTEWLTRTPNHWIPSFASGGYPSDQPSYLALRDKPFIPSTPADIGAASQSDFLASRAQAAAERTALGARITELEKGPTWASIRGKPDLATMDDIAEMQQVMNAMMLRIIALESGGGGSDPDTSHYLTDAAGAHLTDASGAILTGPVTIEGALLDQYGAQLTDASGNILMGPPIAGKTLTDSTGQTLTDGTMAPLLSA